MLGKPVPRELPRILARVGFVPERPHVYPALTVAEALRYHASFYPSWDRGWCAELTERLELDPAQQIARMSKGETGKLLILLALSQRPDLLVLDEPTDGLDPVVRRDVLTAVLDYVSQTSATVFISSHLVHELERICDWVGVLDGGQVVAELPMQSFKNGIKRIRVTDAPAAPGDTPFVILNRIERDALGSMETWIVRGWQDPMRQYFEGVGANVRDGSRRDSRSCRSRWPRSACRWCPSRASEASAPRGSSATRSPAGPQLRCRSIRCSRS
jgi:ABC-2 type transport system ATP-binding protein